MHKGFRVSVVDACQMSAKAATLGYVVCRGSRRDPTTPPKKTDDWATVGINQRATNEMHDGYREAWACLCVCVYAQRKSFVNLRPRFSGKCRGCGKVCVTVDIKGRIKGIVMSPASHVTWELEILETRRRVSTSPKKLTKFRSVRSCKRMWYR